jgi:PPM family protein phosphatase
MSRVVTGPLQTNWASKSEQGRRSTNDDVVLVDPQFGFFLLCDGARGRFGGRTAAELAGAAIQTMLGQLSPEVLLSLGPEAEQAVDTLFSVAHNKILAAQSSDHTLKGMTSTAALVLHSNDQISVSHIGDSRVYLYRSLDLYQLTRDHNLENYLEDNPTAKQKKQLSGKTLIRALGLQASNFHVDHQRLALQNNDLLLICSDGLTDSIPTYTLRELLACCEVSTVEEVADQLIRAAISHGSMDNVSVIVIEISDKPGGEPHTTIFDPRTGAVSSKLAPRLVMGWLTFLEGPRTGQVVPLEASTAIGADSDCRIVIEEDFVSRRHAAISRTEHGFVLQDFDSTNGTFINNVRTKEESLVDGDLIRVGSTEMVFKCHVID